MTTALTKPMGFGEAQVRFVSVQVSKRTQQAYRSDLSKFAEYWDKRGVAFEHVGDIQLDHFVSYRDHLIDDLGLAPATVQRRMSVLKSMMRFAKESGLIRFNPISVMRLPRADPVRPSSVHDESEIRRMLSAVDIDRPCARLHRVVLVCLYYVGMRRQELCDLKVRDFYKHGNHHVLRISGKGGRVRIVPIHPIVLATLNDYLTKNRPTSLQPSDPLFTAAKAAKNRPLSPGSVYYIVAKAAKKAGIKTRSHPHAARASLISHLLVNDRAPITDVSEFVGHHSVATTQRYYRRRKALDASPAYAVNYE